MDIREAYKVMQENCGIEVGDKVRVLRKAKSWEMGWDDSWVEFMNGSIGRVHLVLGVRGKAGIQLSADDFNYPFFVLEIVEKHNAKKTITIDGKEILISKESFEELKKQLLDGYV